MPRFASLLPRKFRSKPKSALGPTQVTGEAQPSVGETTAEGSAHTKNEEDQGGPHVVPRTDKYGLFELAPGEVASAQPATASSTATSSTTWPIDIVALHGITGDAYKTWEHDNGTLWLRDFLLQDFPGCRVFSFGYDADVFFSLGTGNLETYARTMLQSVKQNRVGKQNRPLIFICHSMGGLVVKKAIIYTVLKQDIFQDIRSSCKGIIFLGTPHRGSLQVGWPLLVANIANVATLGTSRLVGKARTDLLKTLERESPVLEQLAREFADQPRNIHIASFVEQDITPPADARIVDGVTGVMNSVGEEVIDMQGCDHKSICRFASRTNNYKLIHGIILQWATQAIPFQQSPTNIDQPPPAQRSENDIECLRSLSFPEMSWRRLDLGDKAFPETCKWVFEHATYQEWLASPHGPLWIKGKPGSGKSTLMEVITRRFRRIANDDGSLLLTFFFNAFGRTSLEKSTAGMYRSLLYQLIDQDPSSLKKFRIVYQNQKQTIQPGSSEVSYWHDKEQNRLKEFLTQALIDFAVRGKNIFILIDALDEVVHGNAQDAIVHLYRLDEKLRQSKPGTRLCFSCRHYPIYTTTNRHEIFMERHNDVDIKHFVRIELAEKGILRREHLKSSGTLATLEDELVRRAYGVFLWAFLITPIVVRQLNVATPLPRILNSLDQAPTRLGEIYSDMIRNVIHEDLRLDSYRLMEWAIHNDEPMFLIRIAIHVDFTPAYAIPRHLKLSEEELDILEIRVGNFSGGLLEVNTESGERAAFYIHPTVKTFLKDEGLQLLRRLQGAGSTNSLRLDSQVVASEHTGKESSSGFQNLGRFRNLGWDTSWRKKSSSALDLPSSYTVRPTCGKGDRGQREDTYYERCDGDEGGGVEVVSATIDAHETKVEETHSITDPWFERLFSETRALSEARDTTKARVKVAIISTGVDMSRATPYKVKNQIEQMKSWVGTEVDIDIWGPGTHAVTLIHTIAPEASMLIARVTEDPFSEVDPEHIAQAIDWVVECEVDIIYFPFSFDRAHHSVHAAMYRAILQDIIVFAAASNGHMPSVVGFPARMNNVFAVYSADARGNPSKFNPLPGTYGTIFSFLGEDVAAAWPMALGEGGTKRLSGLSVATAVATGIAALVLELSCQHPEALELNVLRRLKSFEGMRAVLQYLSSGRGTHGFVTPWKMFSRHRSLPEQASLFNRLLS